MILPIKINTPMDGYGVPGWPACPSIHGQGLRLEVLGGGPADWGQQQYEKLKKVTWGIFCGKKWWFDPTDPRVLLKEIRVNFFFKVIYIYF